MMKFVVKIISSGGVYENFQAPKNMYRLPKFKKNSSRKRKPINN